MRYAIVIALALFFCACGSEGDSSTPIKEEIVEEIIDEESESESEPQEEIISKDIAPLEYNPLYAQQWSINPDATLYSTYSGKLEVDAHINPGTIMRRYDGAGVKIAIIDDGFDVSHPEFSGRIIKRINVVSATSTTQNVSHSSTAAHHGTAVAGIASASNNDIGVVGAASGAELILIKIPMDNTYSDAIGIKAFDEAMRAGADIICCSWGTNDVSDIVKSKIIQVAIEGRENRGTLIVFASGNSDDLMGNDESSIDEVLGVGSTDSENLRSIYSSYGPKLSLMAPGGQTLGISTLDPMGSAGTSTDEYNRYDQKRGTESVFFTGTSASAPLMSGVLALALEAKPNLSRQELFEILSYSTSHIGLNVPYLDIQEGSSSTTPIITGTFGTSGYDAFKLRISSKTGNGYSKEYQVAPLNDREWSLFVSDGLAYGEYRIELVADDDSIVFATNESFVVDSAYRSTSKQIKRRNDFYGYGKVDLSLLFKNIF